MTLNFATLQFWFSASDSEFYPSCCAVFRELKSKRVPETNSPIVKFLYTIAQLLLEWDPDYGDHYSAARRLRLHQPPGAMPVTIWNRSFG